MRRDLAVTAVLLLSLTLLTRPGATADCAAGFLSGAAALRSGDSDDRPGLCRQILPRDLAAPTASHSSFPLVVSPPAGWLPKVPPGFVVSRFHRGADAPRLLRTAPGGEIFVAESRAGRIRVLTPSGYCSLGSASVFASGLDLPFGIAFYPPGPQPLWVYVGETGRVLRFPYRPGDKVARGRPELVATLPQGAGALPGRGHWTRDIVFSRDGRTMFASVGSYSDAQAGGEDETQRAAILAFDPDGTNRRVFARGLRNPVSMAISPVTGTLWASVNERDGLGDLLVPDYVTAVHVGQFFGWPWFYIGRHRDGRPASDPPASLPPVTVPKVLLEAHASSLGSTFYTGTQFPRDYRGNLFVAQHGSWNRAQPTGSKVIRLVFTESGKALPRYEDFMTGFNVAGSSHEVRGRPVGVAVGTGGSLYLSEDANNSIYCVRAAGS